MNRSGKAVRYWMTKTKVNIKNVLVVVDDMALEHGIESYTSKDSEASPLLWKRHGSSI